MTDSDKLDILLKKVDSMENKMGSMGNKMDSMGNKMDSMENKMDSMENKMDSMENRMDTQETETKGIKRSIKKLETMDTMILGEIERVHKILISKTKRMEDKIG